MRTQLLAFKAELLKIKRARIIWTTFIAFALAPVMGAVFILILDNPDAVSKASGLATKARAMDFKANWESYLGILNQSVGVGGVLIFGFLASWIFGREYSDGTAKDLLALPTSRTQVLNAKFMVYVTWVLLLALSNLLLGFIIGKALHLSFSGNDIFWSSITDYWITTLLVILLGMPIAFFALWGKGYMAPLGFVALTLVFSQIIGATGYGSFFPWSVPGLYSGAGGEYKKMLNSFSYVSVFLASALGYLSTVLYWKLSDQSK